MPKYIRSDNGPEFVAQAFQCWLGQLDIEALYIEPGSPWEKGFAESFHSRLRDDFLALEEFESLAAARKLTTAWKEDYNHHRPHSSLGYGAPVEFAARCTAPAPGLKSRQLVALNCGGLFFVYPQWLAALLKLHSIGSNSQPI